MNLKFDTKFKKQWCLAVTGLGAAVLGTMLILNDPAPEQEEPQPDDNTTEIEPPAPPILDKPETDETPENDLPLESGQAMNAADQCIADAVENRIIPSLEYWAREFRTAVEAGLYVDPQPEIRRIESVAADEFARCVVQNGMESSEASGAALEKMENAKQEFIEEFKP